MHKNTSIDLGMVWFVLLISLLLLSPNALCQKTVVSATKMKVLYQGIDNILHIAIEDQPCSRIVAKTSSDQLVRLDDCTYNFRCDSICERNAMIEVGIQMKDSVKWMEKHWFRIRRIPCPTPMVAGIEGGICKVSTLLENPNIELLNYDSLFPVHPHFNIISFSARILDARDSVLYNFTEIKGNRLFPALLSFIATSEPGDHLEIIDIHINMDGKPYPCYPHSAGPYFIINDIISP